MNSAEENDKSDEALARQALWVTTFDLRPGMVIAQPVRALSGGQETLYIRAGGEISEDTISQFIVKGVECVAVVDDRVPDEARSARAVAAHTARLQQIFGPEPNPACQALLDALLHCGPQA